MANTPQNQAQLQANAAKRRKPALAPQNPSDPMAPRPLAPGREFIQRQLTPPPAVQAKNPTDFKPHGPLAFDGAVTGALENIKSAATAAKGLYNQQIAPNVSSVVKQASGMASEAKDGISGFVDRMSQYGRNYHGPRMNLAGGLAKEVVKPKPGMASDAYGPGTGPGPRQSPLASSQYGPGSNQPIAPAATVVPSNKEQRSLTPNQERNKAILQELFKKALPEELQKSMQQYRQSPSVAEAASKALGATQQAPQAPQAVPVSDAAETLKPMVGPLRPSKQGPMVDGFVPAEIGGFDELPQDFKDVFARRTQEGKNIGATKEDAVNAYNKRYASGARTLKDNGGNFYGSAAPKTAPQVQAQAPASVVEAALTGSTGKMTSSQQGPKTPDQVAAEFVAQIEDNPERRASVADRARQEFELREAQTRLGSMPNTTGSNLTPKVDESLTGKGDQIANRQLGNSGISGNSRRGQFNTGSTAYAGDAFSEYDTPRPSTFDPARQEAIVEKMKTDPQAMASRERMMANQAQNGPSGMSENQQALFDAAQGKREDRRTNALAMRREQSIEREQNKARAQAAYGRDPLNNPVVQEMIRRRPEAAMAFLGQLASSQLAASSAMGVAGINAASEDKRTTVLGNEVTGRSTIAQNQLASDEKIAGIKDAGETQRTQMQVEAAEKEAGNVLARMNQNHELTMAQLSANERATVTAAANELEQHRANLAHAEKMQAQANAAGKPMQDALVKTEEAKQKLLDFQGSQSGQLAEMAGNLLPSLIETDQMDTPFAQQMTDAVMGNAAKPAAGSVTVRPIPQSRADGAKLMEKAAPEAAAVLGGDPNAFTKKEIVDRLLALSQTDAGISDKDLKSVVDYSIGRRRSGDVKFVPEQSKLPHIQALNTLFDALSSGNIHNSGQLKKHLEELAKLNQESKDAISANTPPWTGF